MTYMKQINDELIECSAEEIAEIETMIASQPVGYNQWLLDNVLETRNALLASTDWWVVPDRTSTAEQLAYRQALRDITAQSGFPTEVVWPTKPEVTP